MKTQSILELPINSIQIGHRHRKDMGNIKMLADSIKEVGLLHPIVVDESGRLIAGERRLAACKLLGWLNVPVNVARLTEIVRGEFAENIVRKGFVPSEIEAIRRALEPAEKVAATERMTLGKVPTGSGTGKTRDKVAAYAGISGRTLDKIRELTEAAETEPEKFGKLKADMDRTGRVNGPYKRLKVARQAAVIRREPPPLPSRGPYRVIVADPPWPYEVRSADPSHRATQPYPQMSITEICALRVADIAHTDCILWLWTTNHHMREAFNVLDAWGFRQKTILTWVKHKMGTGDWLRGQTEHCLMAVRGKPIVQLTNQTTVLYGPMRKNSQKPEEFYAFVEGLCPAPRYAELFSREERPNWDGHGDEVPNAA